MAMFGVKELREFAENHEDERVRILFRRLAEARSRHSRWCNSLAAVTAERDEAVAAVKQARERLDLRAHWNCPGCGEEITCEDDHGDDCLWSATINKETP